MKKYDDLIDGLECSEILFSKLERTHRIDSEFYQKKNLDVTSQIIKNGSTAIATAFKVSDGNHLAITDHFCHEGIPYYRGQDIYNLFIEDSHPQYIDALAYNSQQMKRSHLFKRDILVSIVGAIVGNISYVSSDRDATCSCKLAILRSINGMISPEMLLVFLKSKYGQNQIQKFRRGTAQTGLILEDFDQLYIPVFGEKYQSTIGTYFDFVQKFTQKSVEVYEQAEGLFADKVNINIASLPCGGCVAQNYSLSIMKTGRLDAEYYQPKYELLCEQIKAGSYDKLGNLVTITKSIEPGSEAYVNAGIPFIRVSNLTKYEIIPSDIFIEKDSEYDISELYLKENDILFSKDGTVGIAYKVSKDQPILTSSAILHLSINDATKLLPDYLTIVLNSQIVQLQAQRDAGGSVINHWTQSEIEEVLIPVLPIPDQIEISDMMNKSYLAKNRALEILNALVHTTEIFIEKGEKRALSWLEENYPLDQFE